MDTTANTNVRLVTKDGRVVYPHDTHLQSEVDKLNYRLDCWEAHRDGGATVYVYEWPSEFTRRQRRSAAEFGLMVQQR
jgi:hypothetical protein